MGLIGGKFGYELLRRVGGTGENGRCDGSAYEGKSKLQVLLGPQIWDDIKNRVVIDFGCGSGEEAVEIAIRGARRVIGIDVRDNALNEAYARAVNAGVEERCTFVRNTSERADVILSIDAFEHFSDPAGVLKKMRLIMKDDGCVIAAFGPTWYHPLGGHLFSVFPWSHLLFTERALIRWRSDFKSDGAKSFGEVEGGLNQMTIARFKNTILESDFRFSAFEAIPIRRLRRLANRFTQEFTTAIVRCKLVPR